MASLLTLPVTAPAAALTFKHIVIVVQENRTPDNLFGSDPTFEPGVDIATGGINSKNKLIPLKAVELANCYDLLHTHEAFEVSLNAGANKVAVAATRSCVVPPNPQFRYVDNSNGQIQAYFDIARHYGFSNRMFQTNQGPSFVAHQFLFGGTSAPSAASALFAAENMTKGNEKAGCIAPSNQTVAVIDGYGSEETHAPVYPCFEHPTLTDVLDAANPPVTWRYYAPMPGSIWTAPDAIRHICQPQPGKVGTVCTGPDWTNGNVVPRDSAKVLQDITSCNLQSVTWAIPDAAWSDHAKINRGYGPDWVALIVDEIGQQPTCANGDNYWNDTAIIITWDDWGGWFDHVKPFEVNVRGSSSPPKWGDGYTYGFRVPMLVVSAYTPAGFVDNQIHDFGSILYFVEQNFGLGFIGQGRTQFGNYADYHASSRGNLSEFFPLATPRPFKPIPVKHVARAFIDAPPSSVGPDDD